jgi:hypothetical protein
VILADVAPQPDFTRLGLLGCAALSCLFLVSTVILVVILVRRSRRGGGAA